MKTANRIGCTGVALVIAGFLLPLLPAPLGNWSTASIAAQIVAFALCLYAGIRGSRWWLLELAAYVLFVGYWFWLLSQGR